MVNQCHICFWHLSLSLCVYRSVRADVCVYLIFRLCISLFAGLLQYICIVNVIRVRLSSSQQTNWYTLSNIYISICVHLVNLTYLHFMKNGGTNLNRGDQPGAPLAFHFNFYFALIIQNLNNTSLLHYFWVIQVFKIW